MKVKSLTKLALLGVSGALITHPLNAAMPTDSTSTKKSESSKEKSSEKNQKDSEKSDKKEQTQQESKGQEEKCGGTCAGAKGSENENLKDPLNLKTKRYDLI
jgi:hypothetical protein